MLVDIPYSLQAGHDYILVADTREVTAPVELRGPDGVVSLTAYFDGNGVEFTAHYTATYFIHYDDANRINAFVVPDCHAGTTTHCHLAVNHVRSGEGSWAGDQDAFKVYLNSRYTYIIRMDGAEGEQKLRLLSVSSAVLLETYDSLYGTYTLIYRPKRTGYFYIEVDNWSYDLGHSYTLVFRRR